MENTHTSDIDATQQSKVPQAEIIGEPNIPVENAIVTYATGMPLSWRK